MRTKLSIAKANAIRLLLTATFWLAITLTFSCSSGDDNNDGGGGNGGGSSVTGGDDGGGNQFSQIYKEDGTAFTGSGVIKIALDTKGEEEILIDAGSVTKGIVKLELPSTIPAKYLRDFIEEDEWHNSTCTDYPEGIKSFLVEGFALTKSNGEIIGDIGTYYEDGPSYTDGSIEERIFYAYFTKAGKINCNYEVGVERNQIYNIDAKEGWNKIYYHRTFPNGISKEEISTDNILTKELKWNIYLD